MGPSVANPDCQKYFKTLLLQVTNEQEERLKVEITEKDDVYFATVQVIVGDPPGASRKIAQKIINTAIGKGIMVTENVKIVGAKEHLLAGEL
ncbi:hypothetical protein HOLleu_35046 [Holothuria leucospilota]|uniref:Uncharacterized protein n=1 Tax=Holothuria leucospilota TaxID=206669 RepID=A0A9Q0YM39_HOLLE|nr:hypothetical protein HOLleu_35046 [Holothuria leucospilota]